MYVYIYMYIEMYFRLGTHKIQTVLIFREEVHLTGLIPSLAASFCNFMWQRAKVMVVDNLFNVELMIRGFHVFVLGEKDRLNNRLFPAWEFQDPKMEVLYHIRPYFGGISPYIALI